MTDEPEAESPKPAPNADPVEVDSRFPSGPWKGFFLDARLPGRHWMDLELTFRSGRLTGTGRDWVGKFLLAGAYDVADGRCRLQKAYLDRHEVAYQGYNEGRGIWGVWSIVAENLKGGFHIWPVGMKDPTGNALYEKASDALEQPVSELVGAASESSSDGER